jgi:hypothetical protein
MMGGFCFDAAIPDKQNCDLEIVGNPYPQNSSPEVQEFWETLHISNFICIFVNTHPKS